MTAAGDVQPRGIRSFVLRAGRLTRGQERALAELWPRFGIELDDAARPIDLDAAFGRAAPCVVEIGFGNGDALTGMAADAPDRNYLGIEVHPPGIGHCLLAIEKHGLTNVRLIRHDAVDVLNRYVADAALAGVHLFFPDPWHKKRHHKRRIVQPPFVELLARKIAPGGYFHVATDWPAYGEHIEAVVSEDPTFRSAAKSPALRPRTRFQARGERLGHPVFERIYDRVADGPPIQP